jgi:hypothetical protein
MATIAKNFRVKNGLIVEGTTATVNGNNILTSGDTTDNVTEGSSNLYFTDERVQDAVDALISAGTHENITITYDDETNSLSFVAENGVADSDTDDLVEGETNLYFTNERVHDAVDALIAAGEHSNITITYDDETNSLSFAAENGVADSTTDDLVEGEDNLYFTNQRAMDAVQSSYEAYADQAEADAITSANSYTDGRETAITTAYQSYADQAEADAITSANAYTDGRETAITTAYQAYADQAEADAISTASADATSKANAAEAAAISSSNSYTDAELGTHESTTSGIHGVTGDIVGTTDSQTLSNKTLGSDLNANSNKVTNLSTPTASTDAANKLYVDEVAQGLKVRGSVEAATDADLGGTYANGTNGVDATITIPATDELDIDGWTAWSQFDGILVKDQTNAEENGRYFVFVVGDEETDWVLKRCIDCDTAEEIPGSFVFVQHGDSYESTGWAATVANVDTFVVGTDDITWVQFSGAGTYLAGNGLELNGNTFEIDTTITATKEYVDGEISDLDTALKTYADTAEADAISSANSYTDGEISALDTSLKAYADTAEADAITAANNYTDGRESAITTAYQSYADQAEADAVSTASADATSKANAAEAAANSYTDGEISSLDASLKAYADQAEADAISTAAADATSKANAAESAANAFTTDAINDLDTDDIEEGQTNLYFTDARAKTSAADLLTGATLENITITGTGSGLTITAENGVADSDTDDLVEGTSNLYFTDQRAVDALQAVTPVFTEIDVNSIALNIAATVDVAVQNTTGTVYSFDSGTYTSAKFLVKADTGTHTEITEVLVTLDSSSNIAITEYAIVNTGGSLVNITAVMNDTDVELQATVVNDNTTVRVYGTLVV